MTDETVECLRSAREGDREAAERFVGSCDLRYNSDRNKLKKRLTN